MTMIARLVAALMLALCLPSVAFAVDPVAEDANTAPVRVVIFEQLMEEPPVGLPVLSNAVKQLEIEFRPRSAEIEALSRRLAAEQIDQTDQAAIDRARTLARELDQKTQDAGQAYNQRQAAIFDPLLQEIDLALQRYAAETPGGEAFLLGWEEFNGEPAGTLVDITAEFVGWMGAQP